MPSNVMRVPTTGRAQRMPEYNLGSGQIVEAQTSARLDDSAGAIALAGYRNGGGGNDDWKYIQQIAENVGKIGENAYRIYDDYQKTRARDAFNQYEQELMVKKAELDNLAGNNALGDNDVERQLESFQREARNRLTRDLGERAKVYFGANADEADAKGKAWAIHKKGQEWKKYQDSVDAGTILNAEQMALQDPGQLGPSMGKIMAALTSRGQREGLSEELIKGQVQEKEQKLLSDVIMNTLNGNDLDGASQLMNTFASKLTPEIRVKYQQKRESLILDQVQALVDARDFEGAKRLVAQTAARGATGGDAFAGMRGRGVGYFTARHESGNEGSTAIGYDGHGGTSYGRWQIASNVGGMASFFKFLKSKGGEAAAIAERLDNAGPANTGNRSKASGMPAQWVRECEANPQLMEQLQHDYIEQTHYRPALNSLPQGLRDMVSNDGALQEMLWSTAVQHGGGGYNKKKERWVGAAGIFRSVWRSGMSPAELVEAVYKKRGGDFGSSSDDVQRAVHNRFNAEKEQILGAIGVPVSSQAQGQNAPQMAQEGTNASGQGNGSTEGATPNTQETSGQNDAPAILGARTSFNMKAQAIIRKAQHQLDQEARVAASGLENQLTYGLERGDFTEAEKTVENLQAMGASERAANAMDSLRLAKEARSALDGATDKPLAQKAQDAHRRLDSLVTTYNAKDATQMRGFVDKTMGQQIEQFKKDPAGFVQNHKALQVEGLSFQERMRRSLELQKTLGDGLSFSTHVLSEAQGLAMRNEYDNLETPADKGKYVAKIQTEAGPYFQQVLNDMKLPDPVVALAPIMSAMPEREMGILVAAAEAKPDTLAGATKDAKTVAGDAVEASKLIQTLRGLSRQNPTNAGIRTMTAHMENTLSNASIMGMDLAELDKRMSIHGEDNAFLIVPAGSGIDAGNAADALNDHRKEVEAELLKTVPLEAEGVERLRLEANLRAVAQDGTWVSEGVNGDAILLDPYTGRPVSFMRKDKEGRQKPEPIRVNMIQLLKDKASTSGPDDDGEEY